MLTAFAIALTLISAPVLAASSYLLMLALFAKRSGSSSTSEAEGRLRFDIVVPAHNEEAGIARTVASLRALDHPPALRRIMVVADNCTDDTADRAREAGADVMVRTDPRPLGKGGVLADAFDRCLDEARADAVVVVDADTVVSPNLLAVFESHLRRGAKAIQAHYAVANPDESWRSALMALAFELFHGVRSLARERLGLSCGLRGNGMCFGADVLRRVPYDAFSVVEDLEYGLSLGRAGHRVHYAADARVVSEMPASEGAARSQRQRWERGRRSIARARMHSLLREAVRRRSLMLLDLVVDLWVPPLANLVAQILLGTLGAGLAWTLGAPLMVAAPWVLSSLFVAAYVARGLCLSELGLRGVAALRAVPLYLVWKASLVLRRRGRLAWVRTPRGPPS